MNRIHVLDAIEEYKNYHSSIFLSYGVNLPFYERAILGRLWKTNSRNNLIFMDSHRYQDTIHHFRDVIGYVGKRYMIVPVNVGSYQAFHPKLILLLGMNRARLIIGSGNLTFSGYGDNLEIFTLFDWSENQSLNLNIFSSTWKLINGIQENWGHSDQAMRMLQKAEYQSPWLSNFPESSIPQIISSSENSLINGISTILDGRIVNKITVFSPFLDNQAQAIKSLFSEFHPSQIDLILQSNRTVADVQSIQNLIDEGVPLKLFQVLQDDRYIHAKIYLFETKKEVLVFSGSANCTQSGFLSDTNKGNYELLTYCRYSNREDAYRFLNSDIRYKPITNINAISFQEHVDLDLKPATSIKLLDAILEGSRLTIKFDLNILSDDIETISLRSDFPKEIELKIHEFSNGKNEYSIILDKEILSLTFGVFSVYIQGESHHYQNFRSNDLWVTNLTELNKRMVFLTPEDEDSARLLREKLISDDRKWEKLYKSLVELVELDVGQLSKVSKVTSKTKSSGEKTEKEKETTFLVIDEFTESQERLAEIEEELIGESRLYAWIEIVFGMFPQDRRKTEGQESKEVIRGKIKKPSKNIEKRFVRLVRRFIRVLDNVEFMLSLPTFYLLAYFSIFQRINWILFTSGVINDQDYLKYSLQIFHGYFGFASDKSPPFSLPFVQNHLNWGYETYWQESEAHLHAMINIHILINIFGDNEIEMEQLDSCFTHLISCLVCIFSPKYLISELDNLDNLADFFNYDAVELYFKLKQAIEKRMLSVADKINEWVIKSDTMLSGNNPEIDPEIIFSANVSLALGDIRIKKYLQRDRNVWGWAGLIQWCAEMDNNNPNGRYLHRLVGVFRHQELTIDLDKVFFELATNRIEEERYQDALDLIDKTLLISERGADDPWIQYVNIIRNKAEFFSKAT